QIRTDLGADAVVTRLREGVVGGIGGFFGKRCLEIEAHAGENAAAAQAAVDFIPPARPFSLVNFYDTGGAPEGAPEPAAIMPLEDEEEDLLFLPDSPTVESVLPSVPAAAEPVFDPFSERLDDAIGRLDSSLDGASAVRASLLLAGVPERIAG